MIILLLFLFHCCWGKLLPNCSHPIYCDTTPGHILDTMQRAIHKQKIFEDQKTFVDMPLKRDVSDVLEAFNQMMKSSSNPDYKKFLDDNFSPKGSEIFTHTPVDFKENPSFLKDIEDSKLREWAKEVHSIWPVLSRRVIHSNKDDMYSSVDVPYPFVVPGDSYFVIMGLLVSEMETTAYYMIRNFFYLVDQYGFIPNGMRVYFLSRSQPPLLTFMVDLYYQHTRNLTFLNESLPYLQKEYDFWMKHRSVNVKNMEGMVLNRYSSNGWGRPRPESYWEDVSVTNSPERFDHIIATAESGIDFSSRWFEKESELSTIETCNIAPVDLNSYLHHNELKISQYLALLGNSSESLRYQRFAARRKEVMTKYMWDDDSRQWWDIDFVKGEKRNQNGRQYLSNFFPIFLGFDDYKDRVVVPLELLAYPGGLPYSLYQNGVNQQQWDFPNAWAPSSYFMIQALEVMSGYDERYEVNKWISNCYCSWKNQDSKVMYEKYNVEELGVHGGGGEYVNQEGFGWTNGVTLYLLSKYGSSIKANSCLDYRTLVIVVSCFTACIVYCLMTFVCVFLARQCIVAIRKERKIVQQGSQDELDETNFEELDSDEETENESPFLAPQQQQKHQEVEDRITEILFQDQTSDLGGHERSKSV